MAESDPAIHQRGDGAATVGFARGPRGTTLARLYQRAPCRVLFPAGPGDPEAVVVTISGGLAGGDRIALELAADAGASACVSTQSMEKIYRALDAPCQVEVRARVEAGATLAWLPQETILFDGARLSRRTAVDVAAGGRFLGCEGVVLGRRARGERFTHGLLHDAWRIRRDGRLIWADALRLDGDVAVQIAAPSGFAGAEALATAIYVGADAADHLALARAIAEDERLRGGASLVNGVLLARLLGSAVAVRAVLVRLLMALRAALGGPAAMPRVWQV
jgi:urease accessory protein